MSGGERQLALIARALVTEAKAIVLDEAHPANLDFGNQARVLAEIGRLRDEWHCGAAVHARSRPCTSDRRTARSFCATARCFAQGPATAVLTAENLSALYSIPVGVTRVEGGGLRAFALSEGPATRRL